MCEEIIAWHELPYQRLILQYSLVQRCFSLHLVIDICTLYHREKFPPEYQTENT